MQISLIHALARLCIIQMTVSFHPLGLLLPLIPIYIFYRFRPSRVTVDEDSKVGLFRRYIALGIDLNISMFALLPLCCMLSLGVEYLATGNWMWGFQREEIYLRDILHTCIILSTFFGIYFYIRWCFWRGVQTLGQAAMGFIVLPAGEYPKLSVKFLVAWATLAWWPFWPWTIFKKKQDYGWDTASQTKARKVKSH